MCTFINNDTQCDRGCAPKALGTITLNMETAKISAGCAYLHHTCCEGWVQGGNSLGHEDERRVIFMMYAVDVFVKRTLLMMHFVPLVI